MLVPVASMAENSRLALEGKAHPEPVASVSTGTDGAFRLEAPEAGMWKVRVEAPGLVPREIDLVPLIEVVDLPTVEMQRDAKLEVRVTGPDGAPLAGARIRVSQEMDLAAAMFLAADGWSVPERIARTDAQGIAVLPRKAGEKLLVEAGAEGLPVALAQEVRTGSVNLRLTAGRPRSIRVVDGAGKKPLGGVHVHVGERLWCVGRTSPDGLLALSMAPDRKEEILLLAEDGRYVQATLDPPGKDEKESRTLSLAAMKSLAGRVVSAVDGRPIAGALVWGVDPGAFRRTGVDGAYRIETPPDLPSVIQAAAPGFLPNEPEVGGPDLERGPTVALQPALVARGVVVDEKGAPVAGVEVGFEASSLAFAQELARTDSAGRFRIGSLVAGTAYELLFSKAGFAPSEVELPPLEPGRPASDLRVVLRKGRTGLGRVVNRAEEPVVGAEIVLTDGESVAEATTGAEGRFEIRDLAAGTFELSVKGRGYAPLSVPGLKIPDGVGSTDLGTVILAPGVAVEGQVVDPQGRPVAGAEVTLSEDSGPFTGFMMEDSSPVALTGADGFFRIEDRGAGETIDLLARRAGYAPSGVPGVQVPPEKPVRIVLSPSVAVEGRTVDQDGKPLSQVMLFVLPADLMSAQMEGSLQPTTAVSDAEGLFRIEGVPPGAIELHAMSLGRPQVVLKNLEVRPGQDLTGVEVVLAAGAVVEGRVLSAAGEPVVGAEVQLVDVESFFPATSDGDGHYRLEGVPPGMRTLQADHGSYRSIQRQLEVRMGSNALDFTFDEEDGTHRISGRVVDQEGAPVANAHVYVEREIGYSDPLSSMSAADGSFTLSGALDGTYWIYASKAGFARSRDGQTVVVSGRAVDGVEIRLGRGGSIVGRILGLEFTQLSEVTVEIAFNEQSGQVMPDGTYRIDHVEPGEVRVVASLSGGARQAEGDVVLEPGVAEARLDLEFGKGFILTGRILINGEPAKGERLFLMHATKPSTRWGQADHEGRFRFDGLSGGDYRLDLINRRSGFPEREIEISADRDLLIELRTGSISGRVLDAAARRPLANATILATPGEAEGETEEATTDSRGVFVLRDVAEGRWKLEASLSGYAPADTEVQVVAGTAVDGVELALQPAEGLTLEILHPAGTPPAAVGIWVLDPAGRPVSSANLPVGEGGRVQVPDVATGAWDLLLDIPGSPLVSVPVTAPGHHRVVLPQSSGLELLVVPLRSEGKRGRLRLTDESGRLFRIPTASGVLSDFVLEAGEGKFDRIPAGDWTITVTSDDGRAWSSTVVFPPGKPAQVALTDE